MRPNLITRLKEEWNNLDPVDPLRGLIADAIDALTQPSKPWVGLTPEEKKEIERLSVYVEGAIRHTEAKLKEKNE